MVAHHFDPRTSDQCGPISASWGNPPSDDFAILEPALGNTYCTIPVEQEELPADHEYRTVVYSIVCRYLVSHTCSDEDSVG